MIATSRRKTRGRMCDARLLPVVIALLLLLHAAHYGSRRHPDQGYGLRVAASQKSSSRPLGPCAINLYGLPRSFKDLVLPSFIQNVVIPNQKYGCDFFVHYHHRLSEPPGRDGRGGTLNPDEILLLRSAIVNATDYQPTIEFTKTTEDEFASSYRALLQELHTARDKHGALLYMPVNHPSYDYDTVNNVVRMFHGQTAAWELMLSFEQATSMHNLHHYSRIAMLRNDVFYTSPVDIYKLPDGSTDDLNEFAVIPGFSQHPVNDRLIYGPRDAVRLWADNRFERLWQHIQHIQKHHPGDGIHSERFLAFTIFPAIRDAGVPILVDSAICFLRVRSDQSIRLDDCRQRGASVDATQRAVEFILQRTCQRNETQSTLVHLECGKS